ncbi:hypothetical protein [Elioraea sp.]|uniref:hypothetical protein n=1 Tax=Elioraea sp. TaxID=2185103 RepID=UPI0021DF32B4|nr:hypothetical protein [Elioraea sp.]GIX10042.1 MAG: hypothetical protein KatS3mg116_1752 [Elioraea sp.]
MGGLFRAPAPPAPTGVPATAPPAPAATGEEETRARRLAAIEARRRGLAGTVATSWRGVLAEALPPAGRKSLLGE